MGQLSLLIILLYKVETTDVMLLTFQSGPTAIGSFVHIFFLQLDQETSTMAGNEYSILPNFIGVCVCVCVCVCVDLRDRQQHATEAAAAPVTFT